MTPLRGACLLQGVGVVFVLTALTVIFFWPILGPNAMQSLGHDFAAYAYPTRLYITQELARGRLPHWTPYAAFGFPLLADIEATTFYPVSLLVSFAAGPTLSYRTLQLQAVLHFVVAGLGMFLLLRRVSAGVAAALFGGVTFMFSGFFWAHSAHLTVIQSASWGPWTLLGGTYLLERGSGGTAIGVGMTLALAVLGGHPQVAYLIVLALGVWLAIGWGSARVSGERPAPPGRLAGLTVAALAIGGGLAAIQLLPTAILTRQSARWHPAPEFLLSDALPLPNLITLVVPLAFRGTARWVSVDEFHAYTGILPFLVAARALLGPRHRWAIAFAGLAGFGLVVAVGVPGSAWVGGVGLFRVPARAVYLFDLGVAGLAGLGLDALLGKTPMPHRGAGRASRVLWATCALTVAGGIWLAYRGVPLVLRDQLAPDFVAQYLRFVGLLLASATVLELARTRRGMRPPLGTIVLTGVLLVDVFTFPRALAWAARAADWHWAPNERAVALAREIGPHRILNQHLFDRPPTMEANGALVYRLPVTAIYTSLWLERYDHFTRRLAPGLPRVPEIYDLMSVRYVASREDLHALVAAPQAEAFSEGFPSHSTSSRLTKRRRVLWEIRDALPRAYLPGGFRVIPAGGEALRALKVGDPRRAVILETAPRRCGAEGALRPGPPGTVRFLADDVDRVRLEVRAPEAGPLVLSDTYYRGWRATIDGTPVRIHRANYLFRAVCVPAGEHVVEFTFHSPGFVPGLIVTGLTGLVSLGVLAWPVASRRRRDRPPVTAG